MSPLADGSQAQPAGHILASGCADTAGYEPAATGQNAPAGRFGRWRGRHRPPRRPAQHASPHVSPHVSPHACRHLSAPLGTAAPVRPSAVTRVAPRHPFPGSGTDFRLQTAMVLPCGGGSRPSASLPRRGLNDDRPPVAEWSCASAGRIPRLTEGAAAENDSSTCPQRFPDT